MVEGARIPHTATVEAPKKVLEGKQLPKNSHEAQQLVSNLGKLITQPDNGGKRTHEVLGNLKDRLSKETGRKAEISKLALVLALTKPVIESLKRLEDKQRDMELPVREEDEIGKIDLNIFIANALGITNAIPELGAYFDQVASAYIAKSKIKLADPLSVDSRSRRGFLKKAALGGLALGAAGIKLSGQNPLDGLVRSASVSPESAVTTITEAVSPEQPKLISPVPETPPEERLVPHEVRMLQDETLNKLWREGEIELRKVVVDGREVMVIDVAKAKTAENSKLKFARLEKNNPVDNRLFSYSSGGDTEIAILQIMSTCATHSFVNAALHLGQYKDENGVPVIINPLLLAEATDLSVDSYQSLRDEIKKDEVYIRTYSSLDVAAQNAALNLGLQERDLNNPRQSRLEKVMKSVFGLNLDRSILTHLPDESQVPGKVAFDPSMFSQEQWDNLRQTYNIEFQDGRVLASTEEGESIHGLYMQQWYKGLVATAENQNQRVAPVFCLRWDESGINHVYTVLGTEVINGKTYFHMVEPHAGDVSPYLIRNGLIKSSKDGSCYIPADKIWKIGFGGASTLSTEPRAPLAVNNKPEEIASREQEVLRTEQLGFRVNSVEAIEKLPAGAGIIRIAGNGDQARDGNFTNPETGKMLELAKQKGLKVVYVYNPPWFPGLEGKPQTLDEVTQNERLTRDAMKAHLAKVLQNDNVVLEIGNEPDETERFWGGDIKSFGKFFEMASGVAHSLKPEVKIILAAFANPQVNLPQLKELVGVLTNAKIDLSKIAVAVHAYSPDSLQWALDNLPVIFGKKDLRMIVTEMNTDKRESDTYMPDLTQMLDTIKQKGVPALIHEFKPEAYTLDYTGADYNVNSTDERFALISQRTDDLVAGSSAVKQKDAVMAATRQVSNSQNT